MKSAGELILYKDFNGTDEEIFYPMASIIERSRRGGMDAKEERQKFYECFHRLLEVSASHGFQGNLWHNYLTYLLISNENAYSRACEIRGNIEEASMRSLCMILRFSVISLNLIWKN